MRLSWSCEVEDGRRYCTKDFPCMGYCPKCGAKIKYKRKSTGRRHCRRHGPIEQRFIQLYYKQDPVLGKILLGSPPNPPYNNA